MGLDWCSWLPDFKYASFIWFKIGEKVFAGYGRQKASQATRLSKQW